jgi:hypothetical protein
MRVHGWDAAEKAEKATTAVSDAVRSGAPLKKLERLGAQAQRAHQTANTAEEAMRSGLTSLPGMAQEVAAKRSLKPLWSHGIKPQATQQGIGGKALLALPAATAVPELAMEQDAEGRGRGERFTRALTEGAAYATTPFLPMAAGAGLAGAVGKAGGLTGKGIDKLIGAISGAKKYEIGDTAGTVPPTDGDAQGGLSV